MTMGPEILGMNFGCVLGALGAWRFPEKDCFLPLLSKVLGYGIVTASTTVKVPQDNRSLKGVNEVFYSLEECSIFTFINRIRCSILKILKHNSIKGLSVTAFELEVVGYTIALSYCLHNGLPFSAYGELAFLLIQALVLVAILYYYSAPLGVKTWMRALLYCAVAPTVLAGQINPVLFEALYASQHAIFFFARIPQIWENYKNKSTGELSFITCFLNFTGSIARVFTSLQEKAPTSVALGSVLGICTNGAILSQIIMYQKPPAKKKAQ